MTLKITQLEINHNEHREDHTRVGWFEVTVGFTVDKDNEYLFKHMLDEWYYQMYVEDPEAYEKALRNCDLTKPHTHELEHKKGWLRGNGFIARKDSGEFVFHEFFTDTPVVRAIVEELKKYQEDPNYTVGRCIQEQEFASLLENLTMWWD